MDCCNASRLRFFSSHNAVRQDTVACAVRGADAARASEAALEILPFARKRTVLFMGFFFFTLGEPHLLFGACLPLGFIFSFVN